MTHTFTIVLASPTEITEAFENAVFEVGCDDAMLFQQGGAIHLEFDRKAKTLIEAIMSAMSELIGIQGVKVQRIGPEDLVTPAEIARRTKSSREAVRLWAAGQRGPGNFPQPISAADKHTRVWRWTEVADWLHQNDPKKWPKDNDAQTIAATNAALTLNAAPPKLRKALGMVIH